MRIFLTLFLCFIVAFQGSVSAHTFQTPCPMDHAGGQTASVDESARIDDRLHEVSAELTNAKAQLQRWIGDDAEQPLGVPPKIDRTRLAKHQLGHEIEQHPDIAVMNARERVALAEAEVAKQDKSADWSWSLMYSKRGSQFGDMVSLGVSIRSSGWSRPRTQSAWRGRQF